MEDLLVAYFSLLNKQEINYCVLRGYELLPQVIQNDIDFGLAENDLANAISITIAYFREHSFQLIHRAHKFHYQQLYFYHPEKKTHLHIDMWTGFFYKGVEYKKMMDVLLHKKKYKGFYIPVKEDELAISFLKEYLHNEKIRLDKREKLQSLVNEDIEKGFKPFFSKKKVDSFKSWILSDKNNIQSQHSTIFNLLKKENITQKGILSYLMIKCRYYLTELRMVFARKGMLIVLIGPDGSGKTTTSNAIEEHLSKVFFAGMTYFHFKFGITPDLSSLMRRKGTSKPSIEKKVQYNSESEENPSYIKKVIYVFYYMIDFFLGNIKMLFYRYRNQVVLFDRYYFDYFIHKDYQKIPKFLKYVYRFISPKPDLLVYLEADPEAIFARKPELSKADIFDQQQQIEQLIQQEGFFQNKVTVNTSRGVEEVVQSLRTKILEIKERTYA